MSSLLSYHIFSFFISNIFENFKFGRNFSKFTAGMGCRLVAVSVKIGGNRRLPIGKENTATVSDRFRLFVASELRASDLSCLPLSLSPSLSGALPESTPTTTTGEALVCGLVRDGWDRWIN